MTNNNWIRDFERKQFEDKMTYESQRQNDLLALQIANQERYRKKEEEKSYKDKIDHLRLALAQASDNRQQEQIQILLNEAQSDYEEYLERKRKSERIGRIISIVLLLIMIPLLFLMFKELFGGQSNRQRSGTSTVQRVLNANEEDEGASEESSQVAISSSSDSISSIVNEQVPSSSSSELPAPYANTEHTSPHEFTVNVTVTDLNIRQEPSLFAKVGRVIPQGTYTIVQISQSDGHTWGKLKSGEGWISLTAIGEAPLAPNSGRAVRVPEKNTKDLTTEEVANWTKAATLAGRTNLSGQLALEEMLVEVWMADDGLVYADLTVTGFPFIDKYRINKDGHLELYTTDGRGNWLVVSEVYTYVQF